MCEPDTGCGTEMRRVLQDLLDFGETRRAICAMTREPHHGPRVAELPLDRIGFPQMPDFERIHVEPRHQVPMSGAGVSLWISCSILAAMRT
jgi:hypothetical protein